MHAVLTAVLPDPVRQRQDRHSCIRRVTSLSGAVDAARSGGPGHSVRQAAAAAEPREHAAQVASTVSGPSDGSSLGEDVAGHDLLGSG